MEVTETATFYRRAVYYVAMSFQLPFKEIKESLEEMHGDTGKRLWGFLVYLLYALATIGALCGLIWGGRFIHGAVVSPVAGAAWKGASGDIRPLLVELAATTLLVLVTAAVLKLTIYDTLNEKIAALEERIRQQGEQALGGMLNRATQRDRNK